MPTEDVREDISFVLCVLLGRVQERMNVSYLLIIPASIIPD